MKRIAGMIAAAAGALVLGWPVLPAGEEKKEVQPEGTKGGLMVLVPAGEFGMGCNRRSDGNCDPDEHPYHQAELGAYYVDVYEVTNDEYALCAAASACRPAKSYPDFDGPRQPVVGVSWDDAVKYCEWAGKKLPTEAQWEKAARGTSGLAFPWGNGACGCKCAIQEDKQLYGCGRERTWDVGSVPAGASPYGAQDMAGNVLEWVSDWYAEDYFKSSPPKDPAGPETGETKVRKGGCYAHVRNYLRASDRTPAAPNTVSNSTGFRCVKSVAEENGAEK